MRTGAAVFGWQVGARVPGGRMGGYGEGGLRWGPPGAGVAWLAVTRGRSVAAACAVAQPGALCRECVLDSGGWYATRGPVPQRFGGCGWRRPERRVLRGFGWMSVIVGP